MDLFISGALLATAFSLFVYSLYKHECRMQKMERKIADTNDKYTG
jgi:hypothetical protein